MRQVVLSCACAGLSFAAGVAIARTHDALSPLEPLPLEVVAAPAPAPAEPTGLSFAAGAYEWTGPEARDAAEAVRVGGREYVASDGAHLQYSFEEFGDAESAHRALHRHARALGGLVSDDGGHSLHGRCSGGDRLAGESVTSNGTRAAVLYWTRGSRLCAINGPSPAHVRALAGWGVD